MSTLRERLDALALKASCEGWGRDRLALAAARMALEDAERKCRQGEEAVPANRWEAGFMAAMRSCAAHVRALRDGLV